MLTELSSFLLIVFCGYIPSFLPVVDHLKDQTRLFGKEIIFGGVGCSVPR